jgi:hypothetical protein
MEEPSARREANLEALATVTGHRLRWPAAGSRIAVHGDACRPEITVRTDDGRWVRLHSQRDPETEADRAVARALEDGPASTVIAIGPGLGYVLDAIARRSPSTRVVALEPLPEVLPHLLARSDLRPRIAAGCLLILGGPDYAGAEQAWRLIDLNGRIARIASPVLVREFGTLVLEANRVAERIVDGARSNAAARRALAGTYLLNTVRNIAAVATQADVRALFGAFVGTPAVVVAAGPSLDRTLHALRNRLDRAVIVAVDTAMRPLLHARIDPHLVVGVDPSEKNGRHLRNLPDPGRSWLVGEGSLVPDAYRAFANRAFLWRVGEHEPWPWLSEAGADCGSLAAWGSVLNSAFDLACRLGCNPIVLVGADLAYTDGAFYCRNTSFEDDWRQWNTEELRRYAFSEALKQRETVPVRDVHGESVLSSRSFLLFRDWLVARAAQSGRRVVNATGGGILYGPGIELAEFDTVPLDPIPGGSDGIRRQLAERWKTSTDVRRPARDRLAGALAGSTGPALPIDRWLAFAEGRVTADELADALAEARSRLATA